MVFSRQHRFDDSDTNNLAKTPTEIDVRSQVPTKSNGTDFRGVSNCESLENTPWLHPISTAPEKRRKSTHNTTQNLRNLQIDHALSREEDSSETDDEHETSHDRVSISESLGNVTIDEKTNDFSHVGAVAQPRLPPRRDLVLSARQLLPILLIELFEAIYFSLAFLLALITSPYARVTQVLTKVT